MSQGRPALAFEVRRASPSESPQALAERALALVDAGADMLVVRMFRPVLSLCLALQGRVYRKAATNSNQGNHCSGDGVAVIKLEPSVEPMQCGSC